MGVIAGANITDTGLVFSLDAANFRSYSGSGNTSFGLVGGIGGTLVNGVGFTSSNGVSFVFDGTNDYILNPDTTLLTFGTNPFTVITWIYPNNDISIRTILSNYLDYNTDYSSYFYLGIYTYNVLSMTNKVLILTSGGSFINNSFGADIDVNTWSCVSFTKSGDNFICYKNGLQVSSATSSNNNFSGTRTAKIGGGVASLPYFPGNISQVSIYNRALTAKEIKQNYNATKKRYGL